MHVIQKTVKARMQKKVYMNAFLKLNNICSLQYDSKSVQKITSKPTDML